MESLGGDKEWRVRFLAQHASIVYYFVLIIVWVLSPSLAYNFSELIEAHAVDTYSEFAESNKELMMTMPPPVIAKKYYEADDMYVFDEFQTARVKGSRRPKIGSLYDVFCNIRDDEAEHVATMAACQDPAVVVRSPNTEAAIFAAAAVSAALAALLSGNIAAVDDSGLSADTVQGIIQGIDLDTVIEGMAGGAVVSEGVAESVEGGGAAAAEGVLAQLIRIISSLRFFVP